MAASIYEELEPQCVVTHNAALPGKLSGATRQIDVPIVCPELETTVVIDCKDWATRPNVSDIGAFCSLVEDVEATAGVMICNRGFSKAARQLARSKGVQLCQLQTLEAASGASTFVFRSFGAERH